MELSFAGSSSAAQAGRRTREVPLQLTVIDADSGFLRVLEKRVEARGWQQHTLAQPIPAARLAADRPDALVVDLALLGDYGLAYLEQVRAALPDLPIVVCTAGSTVALRVRGLRLGADDWLGKPCHPEELIARIEAIVRRRGASGPAVAEAAVLELGEVAIRMDQFQAFVGQRSLDLTRREFELLHLLAANAGQVLERDAIYERVWGYTMAPGDRSVDVFMRKLRIKLQSLSPDWRYIHTHVGVGYRFAPERSGD